MSSGYVRTRITRLKVSGYRSLYDVELEDLPDIVVLQGRNGTGKSNLMRIPSLVLGWAAQLSPVTKRQRFSYEDANTLLGFRRDDFSYGRVPELRIELGMDLGTAIESLIDHPRSPLGRLDLTARIHDVGGAIEIWFENTALGGRPLADLYQENEEENALLSRLTYELRKQSLVLHLGVHRGVEREPFYDRNNPHNPHLRYTSSCFQRHMFAIHVDPALSRRRQLQHISRRLSMLGIFPEGSEIELAPAEDRQLEECRLYVTIPSIGDLPLENLGTGEQQTIIIAASVLAKRCPIVQLEDPEAHLHEESTEKLAEFLQTEVEQTTIDQLWISTRHRVFALAPMHFAVLHEAALGTNVHRTRRSIRLQSS